MIFSLMPLAHLSGALVGRVPVSRDALVQVGSRRESVGKHRPWRDQHSGGLVHV
jgi:hypothetical protein